MDESAQSPIAARHRWRRLHDTDLPDGLTDSKGAADDGARFLRALWHGVLPAGALYPFLIWPNRRLQLPEPFTFDGTLAARIEDLGKTGANVYFHVCAHDPAKIGARGTTASAIAFPGFFIDLDTVDGVHKSTHERPTFDHALALLMQLKLPPNAIVASGGGLQAWWMLDRVLPVGTDEERAALESMTQGFIRRLADDLGFKLDAVGDLARVLRLPGTFNHKTSPPRPVRLLYLGVED